VSASKSVGLNIRIARKAKGLTQQALGDALGYTRTSITNIERGKQDPPVSMLLKIATALEVDMATLFRATKPVPCPHCDGTGFVEEREAS
jgi:transcriptional regulator with XRE-family HTH domain